MVKFCDLAICRFSDCRPMDVLIKIDQFLKRDQFICRTMEQLNFYDEEANFEAVYLLNDNDEEMETAGIGIALGDNEVGDDKPEGVDNALFDEDGRINIELHVSEVLSIK